ncbi:MAG: tRNA uridine(34) 5-carboxymethylaminomethyl modification radical SAM/GNAT enzyme Elp3 [Candidatus Pacebacteria bacterium]|nr:tRNA uridine(34) 5-carboxymethylaminomethyl modification radical SAM/GNAT enzyme Elp3 [Candidatus Paceibacterota bacterium]
MNNIFAKVYIEKDLNNLKRLITKDADLYKEILEIRGEIAKTQKFLGVKTLVGKILNIEKKAHEKGKTKTPTNSEVLMLFQKRLAEGKENLEEDRKKEIEQILKRLKVRSSSGVTVVSLLTKPYPCPGRCIYCPTEVKMPKSYLSKEPAAARALANNFDPYKQMTSRLKALEMNGHPVNKLEIIVIGGTFDYYKKDYQEYFLKEIFRAANEFKTSDLEIKNSNLSFSSLGLTSKKLLKDNLESKSLLDLQTENETANCRIIGISTETRPDYINFETLNWLRHLGVTKIEIGVQHLDQHVLDFNAREMTKESIAEATEMMRSAGFKFVYHMMPNLPESNIEMDVQMFKDLYNSKDFHPDMLKIYPCVILKTSYLYKMFTKKEYKDRETKELKGFDYQPYDDTTLIKVLSDSEREIKNYTRLIRMIRDIPATYILASSKKSNMRELVDDYQKKNGFIQQDIRAREIRDTEVDDADFNLRVTEYDTRHGREYFLEYINKKENDKLAGFARLRLQDDFFDKELKGQENLKVLAENVALIRELHVYGIVKKFGEAGNQSQHVGFGKRLMAEAEKIAKEKGYKKMAVISGVGVREYYKKLGYHLEGTYMIKDLI